VYGNGGASKRGTRKDHGLADACLSPRKSRKRSTQKEKHRYGQRRMRHHILSGYFNRPGEEDEENAACNQSPLARRGRGGDSFQVGEQQQTGSDHHREDSWDFNAVSIEGQEYEKVQRTMAKKREGDLIAGSSQLWERERILERPKAARG